MTRFGDLAGDIAYSDTWTPHEKGDLIMALILHVTVVRDEDAFDVIGYAEMVAMEKLALEDSSN